jgi:tRNA-2-methylthio-N6-dimethylallyladenosine synthase
VPIGKRFHMNAFGCQMNVLDAEVVEGELLRAGYEKCDSDAGADVVLFHTCSVRQQAEDRVWSRLGALRNRRGDEPQMRIVVLGCMAQREGREFFKRMPHVDIICGTRQFPEIVGLLEQTDDGQRVLAVNEEVECLPPQRNLGARPDPWRAFITAMRGCDHTCTYCIVPATRGLQVSIPFDDIVREAEVLAADGVVEITLLGQNIDSYGTDLPSPTSLAALVRRLDTIDGLKRVRFITSHPGDITTQLLDAMGECATAMPFLAMPAQSGSDVVLKRMARKYTADRYREIVAAARGRMPDLELASDWIVGFPGETDAQFEETLQLHRDVEPLTSYVFKYSPRPDTPSFSHFADDIPDAVKRERNQALLAQQDAVSLRRNEGWVGRTVEVLVEGPSKTDVSRVAGRTREHRMAIFTGGAELAGRLVQAKGVRATAATLFCEPV